MASNFLDQDCLINYGGVLNNSLTNKIPCPTSTKGIPVISDSHYTSIENIHNYLGDQTNDFSVLTLNCQSLNAKFDQLKTMIQDFENKGILFSVISLQETWICTDPPDLSRFQLPGYQLIGNKAGCGKHGGLAIYILDD